MSNIAVNDTGCIVVCRLSLYVRSACVNVNGI